MEYIGLLGLIGLVGFFYGKNLNRAFDDLKDELRRAVNNNSDAGSRIDSNEKNIGAVRADLQQTKGRLQNFATNEELEKNSRYLQNEWRTALEDALKKISSDQKDFQNSVLKIEGLEEKISALPAKADLASLQSTLNIFKSTLEKQRSDFDGRLKNLEARPVSSSPTGSVDALESRIVALEAERQNLLNQLVQYKNFFGQVQMHLDAFGKRLEAQQNIVTEFDLVRKNFDALNKKFEAQQKVIDEYDRRIKIIERLPKTPVPEPTTPAPPLLPPLAISDFQIKKRSGTLFSNAANSERSLAAVENLSAITSFLETAPANKKESFNRIIKSYQQNLGKFVDKVRRGKFDEDNFSEEVSEKFFDVLKKYFLATLPVAVYRGRKENPKFYADFLAKINEYLAACYVYTELVEPKQPATSKQIECMNIVKKDTSLRSEDKIIDEVEQLPYFVDYLSEDGDRERFCSEGKMILLKFNG